MNELTPKVVLGVVAHPDDLDFGFSGSVAKWVNEGAEVYYLILTDGSKGSADTSISSSDLIEIRHAEQRAAAKILGVKDVFFMDYEDGNLVNNQDVKKDIVRIIRQVKPDTVLTMDPTFVYSAERGFINHPDHRAAGQAALDAVFPLARDHLSFPELYADGLQPHKVSTVLMINFNKSNHYEDISDTLGKKLQALKAHTSQVSDYQGVKTMLTNFASEAGKQSGYKYAESFIRLDIPA